MKTVIDVVCDSCDGTGLYTGMCERPGTAVVCVRCNGTGCAKISYTPFTQRKGRRGITEVSWSRGCFIGTGVGAVGKSITYSEFNSGKLPPSK